MNSALEYYISKGDPFHRFTINSRGEVYVTAPLDREKQASYEVTVIATDGLDTASARLRIDVLDVNDNNPVCKKVSSLLAKNTNPFVIKQRQCSRKFVTVILDESS